MPQREGTIVRGGVDHALPLGSLGEPAGALFVHRDLERILDFRRAAVARLLA